MPRPWETDADCLFVSDSPSWRAHTGQTLEQAMGYGWMDAIDPEDRAAALREWQDAVGARRWTNLRAAPLFGRDGSVRKWAAMGIDIDERHRTEQALRESEEHHAFVLRLADALRPLGDASQVEASACHMLGEFLRADRAVYAEIEGDQYIIGHSYIHDAPPLAQHGPIAHFGAALAPAYRRGPMPRPGSRPTAPSAATSASRSTSRRRCWPSSRCATPTAARTSSWRPSLTNCAIRWPRAYAAVRCCQRFGR